MFKVMEKGRSTGHDPEHTHFYDWFSATDFYDDLWNTIDSALDEYISETAREIVNKEKEG